MRHVFLAVAAVITAAGLSASPAQAGKVEVKDVHLCCPQCVKNVAGVLAKVDGVSGAKCDQKAKTVTFTTKDDKVTTAALKGLIEAGFFGAATDDGKEVKVEVAAPKAGEKADEVTVKSVHVCCKACQNAIGDLFKDAKVTYSGTGAMKDVKIAGKDLEKAKVLVTLQKAGFTGKVE